MNNTEDEGIDTSLDMDWVASLEMKVSDTNFKDRNREPKLSRVPDILKIVDLQAYEPLIVSLGPYHRNKPHLQDMNQLKWKYLNCVLQENHGVALKDYLDQIKKLEKRARDAYSEEVNMSSNSFVEMMLLDGCFLMLTIKGFSAENPWWIRNVVVRDIFMLENQLPFFLLETLYESAFPYQDRDHVFFRRLTVKLVNWGFSSNLELPSDNETFHHIIHLCLSCIDPTTNNGNGNDNDNDNDNGNQSSTFGFLCNSKLIKTLFVSLPSKLRSSLLSQANKICTSRDSNPEEDLNGNGNGNGNQSSTFGLLCNSKLVKTVCVLLPSKLRSSLLSQGNKRHIVPYANPEEGLPVPELSWIPSATVFNKAGIQLERKKRHHSFLDITFHNGKLEIPQLRIDDLTNSRLRNLIAYEQYSRYSKFHVTSYMVLMDCLINTAADVELLRHHEIIISSSGDSQEIATLFNKPGTYVNKSDDFYFKDVVIAMRKHHDTRYSKWRARLNYNYFGLNHDFFSNPWAVISLFGALCLFVLTVTQSTFAILSYFRPPK